MNKPDYRGILAEFVERMEVKRARSWRKGHPADPISQSTPKGQRNLTIDESIDVLTQIIIDEEKRGEATLMGEDTAIRSEYIARQNTKV